MKFSGVVCYPLLFVSVFGSNLASRRFCNLLGVFWCALTLAQLSCSQHADPYFLGRAMAALLMLYFCSAEADRLQHRAIQHERELLTEGWAGIDGACCTNVEDAARIRAEIGGLTQKVDATVNQLIRAGMSTESLRTAAESGVDMEDFAFVGYSFVFLMLAGDGLPDPATFLTKFNILSYVGVALNFVLLVWTGITWWFSNRDAKVFGALVLQKVVLFVTRPFEHIVLILWMTGHISERRSICLSGLNGTLGWVLVLGFLVARVDRVARLPWIGRGLAQFLVARDLAGFRKAFCAKPACPGVQDRPQTGAITLGCMDEDSSESSDEEAGSASSFSDESTGEEVVWASSKAVTDAPPERSGDWYGP
jgi:hypothetical protein